MFSHTTTGASGIDLMVNTISPPPPRSTYQFQSKVQLKL